MKCSNGDITSMVSGPMVWYYPIHCSCAYDSFFFVLYYIWTTNPHKWNRLLRDMSPTASLFISSYQKVYNQTYTAEHAQNLVQNMLHNNYPEKFPYGHRVTVVAEVGCEMLKLDKGGKIYTECLICNVHTYLYLMSMYKSLSIQIEMIRLYLIFLIHQLLLDAYHVYVHIAMVRWKNLVQ